MKSALAFALALALPTLPAMAQNNVPAIANASASASATANAGQPQIVNQGGQGNASHPAPPAGWPPAVSLLSPDKPLDRKEATAAAMSRVWRNRADRPMRDADGVLRWMFGTSQPRVVCAPLQACDIELQPGETVNNIILGDTAYWRHYEAVSGSPDGRVTHITLQVMDAGRSTSLLIFTDQRTYTIKLVSMQASYTPLTGFTYPQTQQDQQQSWANYKLAAAGHGGMGGVGAGGVDASRIEPLDIKGDRPSWRPTFAYTDGKKTYVEFPAGMEFSDSPALLGLNSDGGLFSGPTERRVIYRWEGRRIVADAVMDRMELVLGVGGSQQKVILQRHF